MKHSETIYLVTEDRYIQPKPDKPYVVNIFREETLVTDALHALGYRTKRVSWSDATVKWDEADWIVIRTTWDYFDRLPEFKLWLNRIPKPKIINPFTLLQWNIDKHYLNDLAKKNLSVVPTKIIPKGSIANLLERVAEWDASEFIIKPTIAGAARLTYRLKRDELTSFEPKLMEFLAHEDFIIQPFVANVISFGELSLMVMGGVYTHGVRKQVKRGDFRVQDDFGGTVEAYQASKEEQNLAEQVVAQIQPQPVYARVDLLRNDAGDWMVSEVELVEPELWFRFSPDAATQYAAAIQRYINQNHAKKPESTHE